MKWKFAVCIALACASVSAIAGQEKPALADLSLSNFFTEGWNEDWVKHSNPDGAPDLSLLRVQTNFVWRDFQVDAYSQQDVSSPKTRNVEFIDTGFAYAFNRRFMLQMLANYQWIDSRASDDRDGTSMCVLGRFQLIDIPRESLALNVKVLTPNDGLGDPRTTFSYALAGWRDLTPLGLYRMGVYFHVQHEMNIGPHEKGARQNALTYDISLAKTWTKPGGVFGNLTTFLEGYAVSNLDGAYSGRTILTVTPGLRFTVKGRHTLVAGVEVPVTGPNPYGETFRFSYYYNF